MRRKSYESPSKRKIKRSKAILGAKREAKAVDAALDLVVFREEIVNSLERVAGKGGVEKVL